MSQRLGAAQAHVPRMFSSHWVLAMRDWTSQISSWKAVHQLSERPPSTAAQSLQRSCKMPPELAIWISKIGVTGLYGFLDGFQQVISQHDHLQYQTSGPR